MTRTETSRRPFSRSRGEHTTRLRTVSAVVWGFLSTARLGVAAIGEGIDSLTHVRHRIKQVWRFLRNASVDPAVAIRTLCREAEALGRPMVAALDWPERPAVPGWNCAAG